MRAPSSISPSPGELLAAPRELRGDKVPVVERYIDRLRSPDTGAPLITGKTPQAERDVLYEKFRGSELNLLIVSKVSTAIDPDAAGDSGLGIRILAGRARRLGHPAPWATNRRASC
jgi:hypothetical protein